MEQPEVSQIIQDEDEMTSIGLKKGIKERLEPFRKEYGSYGKAIDKLIDFFENPSAEYNPISSDLYVSPTITDESLIAKCAATTAI